MARDWKSSDTHYPAIYASESVSPAVDSEGSLLFSFGCDGRGEFAHFEKFSTIEALDILSVVIFCDELGALVRALRRGCGAGRVGLGHSRLWKRANLLCLGEYIIREHFKRSMRLCV